VGQDKAKNEGKNCVPSGHKVKRMPDASQWSEYAAKLDEYENGHACDEDIVHVEQETKQNEALAEKLCDSDLRKARSKVSEQDIAAASASASDAVVGNLCPETDASQRKD
jgi:hypothetical protein